MTDRSQMLSRPAKVELLRLLGRSRLYNAITGTYCTCMGRRTTTRPNREWKYLNALAEVHYGYFCYADEPLKGVTEESYQLARDNAELDKFVMDLIKGGEELYIPGVIPSPNLIRAIVEAFKLYSPALVNLRPLRIRCSHAALNLHDVWPDAGERRIRPCPFCVPIVERNNASFPVPHVTDRYHILNAETGQQLTIEISQSCHRPVDAYGKQVERRSGIDFLRLIVDDNVRCQPMLPDGPKRSLTLPIQEDLLLEAFAFASRDDLDASQLSCKFWRDLVTETAATLALRPLQRVFIVGFGHCHHRNGFCVQSDTRRCIRRLVATDSRIPPPWRVPPVVMSLLRHGCALRYESRSMYLFCAITRHLADTKIMFRAKSVILRCSKLQEIISSLSMSAEVGAKDFDLRYEDIDDGAPLIFASEVLLNAERFQLQTRSFDDSYATAASALSVREHCHRYLRKAVGCHVSFQQYGSYALFSCDEIIERFLVAVRGDDFTMPLSFQIQFDSIRSGIPTPTYCKHPTLRDVSISHKSLRHVHGDDALKFDVYHFRNERTDEWLTVCLGKNREGSIVYVILQKGRIMALLENIGKM